MDNDLKHAKVSQSKEMGVNGQVSHVISPQYLRFSVNDDKTESRETHKQATTEGGGSKG